jgi:hypothetical protein
MLMDVMFFCEGDSIWTQKWMWLYLLIYEPASHEECNWERIWHCYSDDVLMFPTLRRNEGIQQPNGKLSHPRIPESSAAPLWKPQILLCICFDEYLKVIPYITRTRRKIGLPSGMWYRVAAQVITVILKEHVTIFKVLPGLWTSKDAEL